MWPLHFISLSTVFVEFCFLCSRSVDVCAAGHRHSGAFPRAEQGKSDALFISINLIFVWDNGRKWTEIVFTYMLVPPFHPPTVIFS